VWQGAVKERAFQGFQTHTVHSAEAARQLLAAKGVGHYGDAAAGHAPELLAPAVAL
jgi:hypothetical protein